MNTTQPDFTKTDLNKTRTLLYQYYNATGQMRKRTVDSLLKKSSDTGNVLFYAIAIILGENFNEFQSECAASRKAGVTEVDSHWQLQALGKLDLGPNNTIAVALKDDPHKSQNIDLALPSDYVDAILYLTGGK
jgi:hypothetical protein